MNDNNIIEKIRKLLRLADPTRGASEAEAELAMQRAQELMTQHNISLAAVGNEDGEVPAAFVVGKDVYQTGRRKMDIDQYTSWVLKEVLEIKVAWMKYVDKDAKGKWCQRHAYILIGGENEREYAKLLIEMLCSAMTVGLSKYLKDRGTKWTSPVANSYYRGVHDGFIRAAKEGRNKAVDAAPEAARNSYALAVIDKKKAIALWTDENMNLRKGRAFNREEADYGAYLDGRARGASLDIGNKKVTSGSHKLS